MLSIISQLYQYGKTNLSHLSAILFLIVFLASNGLLAQAQQFDPDGLVEAKLKIVQKTDPDDIISLSQDEKTYINENLKAIRARKKTVKRDLKKAQALEQPDQVQKLGEELEELTHLTSKYYDILYKSNKEN